MNFILKDDTLLTKEECHNIIEWVFANKKLLIDPYNNTHTRYQHCDLMHVDDSFSECFYNATLEPIPRAITKLVDSYVEEYPETNPLDAFEVEYVRFKWWKPGDFYSVWHSEHGKNTPYRVLSFLIYLSDNEAETEFKRYDNVATKAGCGIIFPAYFTHHHRGSPCRKGLDRYILSGYCSFV